MSLRSPRSLGAVGCVLVLLAGACGSSSAGTSSEVAAQGGTEEPATATAPATSSEPSGTIESPLAELLGIPLNDSDAAEHYFNDLDRQAEVKIAECMLTQGFEYQAVDYSQIGGLDSKIDFESREFAAEYGFGIASNPFEESFEAVKSFTDPNQEYVEKLTEGERDAYQTALSGGLPGSSSDDARGFKPSGCQGNAFEEVNAFGEVFEQFADQFEENKQAFDADPRIVGATTGWSSCMGEAGHSYSDQASAEGDVRRRYDSIVRSPDAFADDGDAKSSSVVSEDGAEVKEFAFGPQTLNPEFQAQVDELAVEERAIARASWECSEPLREIEDDVQVEYEQRFVDQNGAVIGEALGE